MRVRKGKKIWLAALMVFVAVFLFTFLTAKFKGGEDVDAANLANFDPGYIISDYQMGNYNSMSEADIQAFLTAKNPCNNTNYNYYLQLSANRNYTWHFENGHFVCLSEERFGNNDNEIGFQYGESAAHIIWQAAQDYRINPQVLIVLLQKETGLVTDKIPNNGDYRKATGYGCPDTAACSSKYYGFKNQIRNAAALFRTVLDGGWTNYPLGNNYIQYNPSSACGGSWVNIQSLATSALYRYTPYQPNASALAAGYGAGDSCGAYGNRNFYNYFEDWFGGITVAQRSVRIPDGLYYIRSAATKDMMVDVSNGSDINGTNIQLYFSNNTGAQKWNIVYNVDTDDYSVVNFVSGKALDVEGASVDSGANVQLWDSNKTCAQRWKFVGTGGDDIKLLSSCSSKALDVSDGIMASGTNLKIWNDNGTDAQKWEVMPVEVVPDGLYEVYSTLEVDKVIDVSGGSHNAKNGTNIQIWNKNNTAAQRWYIKYERDGYYTIRNLQSGKSIDVEAAGDKNGTNIQAWSINDTCAQKWKILRIKNEYTFISTCSNKVMDLAAANTEKGSNIQLYEANNTGAQKWKLSLVEKVKNGEYIITSKLSDKKVVDVAGNNRMNGTNIQLYDYNGTSAQVWNIEYDKNTDTYRIYNNGVEKALDAEAAGVMSGTNIQTWNRNGTCAQKWSISRVGDIYEISSACSGLALDVEMAQIRNGANIQLYSHNNTNAQKWVLKTISY